MDIVASHSNADFDAVASQVAVSLLHPGTCRVNAGGVSRNVRDFMALHKDCFELTPVQEVDLAAVRRLFVVDVRRRGRLSHVAPLLERMDAGDPRLAVHVFDHHGAAPDDVEGHFSQVEAVGATTTLLVEQLRDRQVALTPVEATLLALGIYSDTGSLTYPSTTPRDAEAATYVLRRGASLSTLRFFLHAPLEQDRRRVMVQLLTESTVVDLHGVRIALAQADLERPVHGLSEVVNDVMMLERAEALFALFPRGRQVTVVGRAQVPYIDVGTTLQALGGGGHPGAGAAVLKDIVADEARARLLQALHEAPPRPALVRHLMTTPVHTVRHDFSLDEVLEHFDQRHISGAPVLRDDRVVGVISRRDIRAATRRGHRELPVTSCMAHEVRTVAPDEPLVRAFEQMVAADIGRLPVMERGNLVGIITRSDARRVLYRVQA